MDPIQALDARIASRHLLDHTFYQRWNAGTLSADELREYARQYFHYAMAFPTFVSAMHAHTDDLPTRQLLLENLIEEERGPENHPELWLRFCESLGLDREDVKRGIANDSTRALIATMRDLAREGALHEGLASLYAYESQIPAVAKAKIEGLAKWYGISADRDTAFFRVHMDADVVHANTSREILRDLCATDEQAQEAERAAGRTLDALYAFLDSVTA
ncbi:MAG: CADD family putative folate metabolism protein [Acidobacteria bacterium]|nr:CADD family putative folate metabolism protein [Acidobacteriota bacterium]MBV9476631.1 CADD family putative folate metabolism protein [Acidobacteriota bacterium]